MKNYPSSFWQDFLVRSKQKSLQNKKSSKSGMQEFLELEEYSDSEFVIEIK